MCIRDRGGAVDIVVHNIGYMLLSDGLDGQSQLAADGLAGVPGVGGLKLSRMGNLRFKLLRRQIAAVSLCQSQTVILHLSLIHI